MSTRESSLNWEPAANGADRLNHFHNQAPHGILAGADHAPEGHKAPHDVNGFDGRPSGFELDEKSHFVAPLPQMSTGS